MKVNNNETTHEQWHKKKNLEDEVYGNSNVCEWKGQGIDVFSVIIIVTSVKKQ